MLRPAIAGARGEERDLAALLGAFADPADRPSAAAALASFLGCESVLLFASDAESGRLLPAPGLSRTLPEPDVWSGFLARCEARGEATGVLPGPDGEERPARGVARGAAVAVLLGGDVEKADLTAVVGILPALGSLFRTERRALAAECRELEAEEEVEARTRSLRAQAAELEALSAKLRERTVETEMSRATLEAFYGALPAPAALVGTDLRYRSVNPALARAHGRPVETIVGKALHEVIPHAVSRVEPMYHKVLETGEPLQDVEITVPGAPDGGNEKHWLVNYFPVRLPDGEITAVGLVALDVSDRRAAERSAREQAEVAEALHDVGRSLTAELDLERIVQAVTDAGTRLTTAEFGAFFYNVVDARGERYTLYTISGVPREAFSRFPMPRNTPLFGPTFHGDAVVRSGDVLRDPRYGRMPPWRGMPPGHLRVRSYLAVPVTSRTGEVLGGLFFGHGDPDVFQEHHERLAIGLASWAAVAMDNAHLFEAETRARAEAERANRAKSEFLAVVSHELRTPLNAVLGYTDLLLMGVPQALASPSLKHVERIGLSARHLLDLIEEILTFSRLEAGEERVEAGTVVLRELLEAVEALVEPLALTKGIRFEMEAPGEPGEAESDARKLRQILLNLLSNAVKYTDEGTVGLALEAGDEELVFRIRDTGTGIAPEHREKIFEPFWQVREESLLSRGGTGLGLSVTRRLARILGGDVTVESELGRGSVFTVTVPRCSPPAPPEA